MRWGLILEEYSPDLQYVQRDKNIVADALSRLHKTNEKFGIDKYPETFGMEDKESKQYVFPLKYSRIERHQQKDAALQKKALTNDSYTLKTFRGGKTAPHKLIAKQN